MNESTPLSAVNQEDKPISLLRYRTQRPAARTRVMLPQHMFTFLLEGEKTVHFAGAQVTVKPTGFVLLAAGNCLMSEKVAAQDADYHSILLLFDQQLLTDFFSRHAAWLGRPQKQAASQPLLLFEKDEFLVNFTCSLDCLLRSATPPNYALQQVKLEELLLYLAVHYPGQIQQLRGMGYEASDELLVRQAVTSHIGSPITVEELAFLCNMSLSTFKRRFARLYGTSPNRWLLEKRMDRAAKLLRQDDRKVSEIYDELGYENPSSFIQSFKQIYGVTPKQYQLTN